MPRAMALTVVASVVVLAGCAGLGPVMTESLAAPVAVCAAGSLRQVLTEIALFHETRTGQRVVLTYVASGFLRERIEKGEAATVFASASTERSQRLAASGGWGPHQVFVRNSLCALTSDRVSNRPPTLPDTLLDPTIRVATPTPKADPSVDGAWALFRQAGALVPGAYAQLGAQALKLNGGADSPKTPVGWGTYACSMNLGQAKVFLSCCTNAVAAHQEVPRLWVVSVPPALQMGAACDATVHQGASAPVQATGQALLAPQTQATVARCGFEPPV